MNEEDVVDTCDILLAGATYASNSEDPIGTSLRVPDRIVGV